MITINYTVWMCVSAEKDVKIAVQGTKLEAALLMLSAGTGTPRTVAEGQGTPLAGEVRGGTPMPYSSLQQFFHTQ